MISRAITAPMIYAVEVLTTKKESVLAIDIVAFMSIFLKTMQRCSGNHKYFERNIIRI